MEEYHIEEAHRELVSTFRFTTYHEPLKRWPFNVDESLKKRVKTHGNFPRLLLEQSATKGISRNRKVLSVKTLSIQRYGKLLFRYSRYISKFVNNFTIAYAQRTK